MSSLVRRGWNASPRSAALLTTAVRVSLQVRGKWPSSPALPAGWHRSARNVPALRPPSSDILPEPDDGTCDPVSQIAARPRAPARAKALPLPEDQAGASDQGSGHRLRTD